MKENVRVMSMSRIPVRLACGLLLATLAFLSGACDNESDPTAPVDSVITVDANPQTVVVPIGGQGITTITATLRSKNGTRIPDQEISFSTSSGFFDSGFDNPTVTDDQGEAIIDLFIGNAATVTARSGNITGTTQLQTSPGQLTQFLLGVDPTELFTCNDVVTLTASVMDPNGSALPNVLVIFDEVMSTITGTFSPNSQVRTDVSGTATVDWLPGGQCQTKCVAGADPNNLAGNCLLFFVAADSSGAFTSVEQEVTDNIP